MTVMHLTDFHASFIAHELTRRCPSDSAEKLTAVLADAQVDLNPHQIDAAMFALDNPLSSGPLSNGVILADEVGLGKTIEAALLIAQTWAEQKRRVLVIVPASLRKQWRQELADKFFLPSEILDKKTFDAAVKTGRLNPFESASIVICSYEFAKKSEPYIGQVNWDLVVLDEAHRLRNVYLPKNKIANAIKRAIAPFRKVLLTATPLQNSLLELYGLVSVVDDHAFGDLTAFKKRYGYNRAEDGETFDELKERLKPLCKRTLRRQVLKYIEFTERHAIRQEFTPSDQEHRLYELVSAYLQRDKLYALPTAQRKLMTLMLRKQLASSTFAISGTLKKFADRLDGLLKSAVAAVGQGGDTAPGLSATRHDTAADGVADSLADSLSDDSDDADDLQEEWNTSIEHGIADDDSETGRESAEDDLADNGGDARKEKDQEQDKDDDDDLSDADDDAEDQVCLTAEQLVELQEERDLLLQYHELAKSIEENSKGHVLLTALRQGFDLATEKQKQAREAAKREHGTSPASVDAVTAAATPIQEKAIIFTESRRTQDYLRRILESEATGYHGKVVLFNGSNTDPAAKAIYAEWLKKHAGTDRISGSAEADMRAALVEHFRDHATIMIATEAAAEGINLQFCNLIINYDMPWNPQRIEQRIGRCHRYGQKCDVVVVNFVNKKNEADVRVYELLDEKLKLFSGVFGASDEVLGALESGVDFEKRIADIYQKCRTPNDIKREFAALSKEVEQEVSAKKAAARNRLLDNFDQDVVEKVKVGTKDQVDRYSDKLWELARYQLGESATFRDDSREFTLSGNPYEGEDIHPGPYRMAKNVEDANTFRVGHPLAQRMLTAASGLRPTPADVAFDYTESAKNIAVLEPLVGKAGWLTCYQLTLSALETEDAIIVGGFGDDGEPLSPEQARRLFDVSGSVGATVEIPADVSSRLTNTAAAEEQGLLDSLEQRNLRWYQREIDKLERWLADRDVTLRADLDKLEAKIAETRRAAAAAPSVPKRMEIQQEVRKLEKKRSEEVKPAYEQALTAAEAENNARAEAIERRLTHTLTRTPLFQLRWRVV